MSRRCPLRWLALAAAALAVAPALAGAPIYKCLDNHLGLVYTDLPCKDGEQLDIRAGDADQAAVAHLERERDQLDLSVAQRTADERHAALRWTAPWMPPAADEDRGAQQAMSGPLDYGYFTYPTLLRPPPHRRAHRPPEEVRRFAPRPPYTVPRP